MYLWFFTLWESFDMILINTVISRWSVKPIQVNSSKRPHTLVRCEFHHGDDSIDTWRGWYNCTEHELLVPEKNSDSFGLIWTEQGTAHAWKLKARLNNPHGSRLIPRADSCTCRAEKRHTLGRKGWMHRARDRGGTNMSQPRMWSCLWACVSACPRLRGLDDWWLGAARPGPRRAERTRGLAGHGCCSRTCAKPTTCRWSFRCTPARTQYQQALSLASEYPTAMKKW
jgi:hypothetical protein